MAAVVDLKYGLYFLINSTGNFFSYFISTSQKRQFSHTTLYGTLLIEYNNINFAPTYELIMGLYVSNVLSTTNNCSRKLSASSVVVYQLLGVATATPF